MDNFRVNINLFDNEKPIGVSGLMRIKNDADFVSLSIDSCIDALDELVIVYDDSEDNTAVIIHKKKQEYPEKIKIYYYEPEIYAHNLSENKYEEVLNLSSDSEHLLANYYNWTMSKASYRYAVKIDADQIYFTSKLKKICDLYRSPEKCNINFCEYFAYIYYRLVCKLFAIIPMMLNQYTSHFFFCKKLMRNVKTYIFKKIQNDKIITSFSGINIFHNKSTYVPTGQFADGIQPPINGSGDHIFFPISSRNIYLRWPQKQYNRIIEVMQPSERMYFGGGFLWVHLNAMRKGIYERNKVKYQGHTMPIGDFLKTNFFDIEKKTKFKISPFIRPIIYSSLLIDKEDIIENVSSLVCDLNNTINYNS